MALENLETLAEIREDRLEITFRRNISGITQRLGAIALKKDEDQEINTVAWAVNAVSRSRGLEKEVQGLQKKYNEQGETIRKLNKQLDELIEAKKEHENSLLQKFRELLNAKKLKIRDQQRLLAGAKVDPTKGSIVCLFRILFLYPSSSYLIYLTLRSKPPKSKQPGPLRQQLPALPLLPVPISVSRQQLPKSPHPTLKATASRKWQWTASQRPTT